MADKVEALSFQGFLRTDARKIPIGIHRGDFLINFLTADSSHTDPSRKLVIPRGMEGLVEPSLQLVKTINPNARIGIVALSLNENNQRQYLLQSRSILDTGDYLETLVGAMSKFVALDMKGNLTQEEITVQVSEHLESLAS